MEFKKYFEEKIISGKEKFTLVIGSGFHKKCNNPKVLLYSWAELFKCMNYPFDLGGNYILDFERWIRCKSKNNQANQTEKELLKSIAGRIKQEQNDLSDKDLASYPIELFNPKFVSDIIILNFDEVVEQLLKKFKKCKSSKFKYVEIETEKKKNAKVHQTTRFREAIFPDGQRIRLWHPHGYVSRYESMILSVNNYANHVTNVERLRRYSKESERKNSKLNTWYDQLTYQPVLILGASISNAEWDLWSAFVKRERNFSNTEFQKFRKPIYQMRVKVDSACPYSVPDRNNEVWFEPLFDMNMLFEKQWDEIIKMFK